MGSRHLQGTVFSRVKALLATGAMAEKPVWFDVMAAFPPLVESKMSDIPEGGRPPVIRFKEDDVRDAFLERFPLLKKFPLRLLEEESVAKKVQMEKDKYEKKFSGLPSLDTLVEKFKEYSALGNDFDTAINKTVEWVLSEMEDARIKHAWAKQVKILKKQEQELDKENEGREEIPDTIDITDLFKLSNKTIMRK